MRRKWKWVKQYDFSSKESKEFYNRGRGLSAASLRRLQATPPLQTSLLVVTYGLQDQKNFNLIENKIKKKLTWRLRIKPFYTRFDIFNVTHVLFHGVIESVIFWHWHYALVSHKWGNVRTPSSENSWNFWNENLVFFIIIKKFQRSVILERPQNLKKTPQSFWHYLVMFSKFMGLLRVVEL